MASGISCDFCECRAHITYSGIQKERFVVYWQHEAMALDRTSCKMNKRRSYDLMIYGESPSTNNLAR